MKLTDFQIVVLILLAVGVVVWGAYLGIETGAALGTMFR